MTLLKLKRNATYVIATERLLSRDQIEGYQAALHRLSPTNKFVVLSGLGMVDIRPLGLLDRLLSRLWPKLASIPEPPLEEKP
jgi:hypothetical protein